MIRKITLVLFLITLLPSCLTVEGSAPTRAPVLFVTSTLPPTKPGLTLPTAVPPTASPTLDPAAATPTPSCRDSALFVEDVTYPDNTHLKAGEKFTKTWKFQNAGTCKWTGYTVAFVSGDKMEAPDANTVVLTTGSQDLVPGNNTSNKVVTVISQAPQINNAGALLTYESGPVNGAIDPGEVVTLSLALQNVGAQDTTTNFSALRFSRSKALPKLPSGRENVGVSTRWAQPPQAARNHRAACVDVERVGPAPGVPD